MRVEIKKYDISNPKEVIEASTHLTIYNVRVHGKNTKLEIREINPFWIAVSNDFPYEILGYVYHRFTGHSLSNSPVRFLHDVSKYFINPGLIIVDPKYIGNKIGTILNEQRKRHAEDLEKILLIMPKRPGEELPKEERDRRFPFSTEQLREYYLRHGFKEFTESEAENCVSWLDAFRSRVEIQLDSLVDICQESPPLPDPIFGESKSEKMLKLASQLPLIKIFFQNALYKRRPMKEWRKEQEQKRLHENSNYKYVMSHLFYKGANIDITKVSPFS
jgi:hypothetical protein